MAIAKYIKLHEPVFIQKCELINSRYGTRVYEITMMGIKTQLQYYTYVDPVNVNYRTWQPIIELHQRKGVVLQNLKFKDQQKNLINADSEAQIEYAVGKQELHAELEKYWDQQDQFTRLFGSEIGHP